MPSARDVWELSRAMLADQDGYIAVLKVYMDESGTHDGSDVVTVAAYIAKPRVWMDFTKRWNLAKRPIRVFHAVDCANLKEEFEGWDPIERDKYVAKILPVIGDTEMLLPLAAGIVLKDYDMLLPPSDPVRDMLGNPYGACFHWVVQTLLESLAQRGDSTQRIAFFHEINQFKEDALRTFDLIKERYPGRSLTLTFGTKQDYVPLQSADILAYESMKRLRQAKDRPERRAFSALKIRGRGRLMYYDKVNLPGLISKMRQADSKLAELKA
jgi:Protein of unknown function (DUF3800)